MSVLLKDSNTLSDKLIWLLTVLLISSMYIWTSESYGAYILLAVTVVILGIYVFKHNWKMNIELGMFHYLILLFCFYCMISALWGWNPRGAIQKGVTILEILVCMSVLYMYYQEKDDLWPLVNAIKWSGFVVVLYTISFYGLDTIQRILVNASRLDNDYANVNTIGMLAAIAIIIVVFEQIHLKINILSIALSIPCIVMVAATGSRKALVMVGMGVILSIAFKSKGKNIFYDILRLGIAAIVLFFVFRFILSLDMFSGVMKRMAGLQALVTGTGKVDHSSLIRSYYTKTGVEQFFKTPIFGIGIDGARILIGQTYGEATYLHNNFVEMLCCGGIIGFLIYYSMYFYCGRQLIVNNIKTPLSKICMILLIINLVMDYGVVSYYTKSTYIFFVLFFLQAKKVMKDGI